MSKYSELSAPKPAPSRKRKLIIGAVALIALVATGIGIGAAVDDANARAEVQAAAEAERLTAEKAHADSLETAEQVRDEGARAYAAAGLSKPPKNNDELGLALRVLDDTLKAPNSTTQQLTDAAALVVASIRQLEPREQPLTEADRTLDAEYEALAASLKGNSMDPSLEGRAYCEYLNQEYTPGNILLDLWNGGIASVEIDVAAVRVYCPEFAPQVDLVLSGFSAGDHIVGDTIKPGTYRTAGGVKNCYWERNDGSGKIIDNGFVTAAHNGVTVTVKAGEGFSTDGCGLWIPAG